MDILGALGQLYMNVLLLLLFAGSGLAVWAVINSFQSKGNNKVQSKATTKNSESSKNILTNIEFDKKLGGIIMNGNGWFKLAIFSLVGIVISAVLLGFVSTNSGTGMNMNDMNGMNMNSNQQSNMNNSTMGNNSMQNGMTNNNNNMNMNNNSMNNNNMGNGSMQSGMSMNGQGAMNGTNNNASIQEQLNSIQNQLNQLQSQMQQSQMNNTQNQNSNMSNGSSSSGSMSSGGGMGMM